MKKVLIIGYVWPEPKSSAAGAHILSIMRVLKEAQYIVEFSTPSAKTEHMIDLEQEGISSKEIKLNCDSFNSYIQDYDPDIVIFDRFMMEEQFGWRVDEYAPNALKILDTEDLQFLRNARHEALKKDEDVSTKHLYSSLAKREIAAILRCDLSLIVSFYEMDLLINEFKIDKNLLHHLPFMLDLDDLPLETKSFDERKDFMTIGNFRHAPNWDAVLTLQKIWPKIRKELPKAELHIYGSYPPAKATALNNPKTGFLIKGWAEDAFSVIENARICLSPLRFGAGIKGKLFDAMLMQTPSITSDIGKEGMVKDEKWPGAVCIDEDEFVKSAVELYTNEKKWQEASRSSKKILENIYDKKVLEKELLVKIKSLEENKAEHRLDNFFGSMLKHHTMASTKYMSQWISEKNKNIDNKKV